MDNANKLRYLDRPAGWLAPFPPRRWHLLLAAACIVAVYLAGVTDKWWPTSDSAMYLGLGRSLAEGRGYTFNGEVHGFVTPGLPMILAGLRRFFGEAYWAPNLFVTVCGLATLMMVFGFISKAADRRTALAVVLCCAFSYTFYFNSHRILTDMPFMMLCWAMLCMTARTIRGSLWWLVVVMVLVFTALAVRAPGVLVFGAMAIGLLFDQPKKSSFRKRVFLAAGILVASMATIAFFHVLGQHMSNDSSLYVTAARELGTKSLLTRRVGQLGEMAFRLPVWTAETFTSQNGLWMLAIPLLVVIAVGGVSLWKRGCRMPSITIVLYVISMAVVGGPSMIRSRYLLPMQPFLVYMMIEGLLWTVRAVCRLKGNVPKPSLYLKVVTVFSIIVIGCNSPRLLRNAFYYSYLSHTPRYYEVIRRGRYAERFRVAERLRDICPPDGLVAVPLDETNILHYLSDRRVIPLPDTPQRDASDAERVAKFLRDGHDKISVVVVDVKESQSGFREEFRKLFPKVVELR